MRLPFSQLVSLTAAADFRSASSCTIGHNFLRRHVHAFLYYLSAFDSNCPRAWPLLRVLPWDVGLAPEDHEAISVYLAGHLWRGASTATDIDAPSYGEARRVASGDALQVGSRPLQADHIAMQSWTS